MKPGRSLGALTAAGSHVWLRLAQYGLLFVAGLVLTRALGPEGRSEYALPLAFAGVAALVMGLSLEYSTGRLLARKEADARAVVRVLSTAVVLLGGAGVLVVLLVGLPLRESLLSGASVAAVVVGALLVPILLAQTFAGGLAIRLGGLRTYGVASAAGASLQLIVTLVLALRDDLTPVLGLAATGAGSALTALSLVVWVGRHVDRGALVPRRPSPLFWTSARAGVALHPTVIGLVLTLRVDLFLVSLLLDARQTGLYSLATSLAEMVFFAAFSLAQAAMSSQTLDDDAMAAQSTIRYLRGSLAFGGAIAAVACLASYPLVEVVYGPEWRGAIAPLIILAVAAVVLSVEAPLRVFLIRMLNPVQAATPAAVAMVVNVAGSLILIPVLGIVGAAVASLVSYAVFAVLALRLFAGVRGAPLTAALRRQP